MEVLPASDRSLCLGSFEVVRRKLREGYKLAGNGLRRNLVVNFLFKFTSIGHATIYQVLNFCIAVTPVENCFEKIIFHLRRNS